jgi:hypothetical protein
MPTASMNTRKNKFILNSLELAPNSTANATPQRIAEFIDEFVKLGPQIVSLPVPSERHAILVNITPTNIKISDWNGERNPRHKNADRWNTYFVFLELLKKKYPKRKLVFYEVDEELRDISMEHHVRFRNSGGCSYYIYQWFDKYKNDILAE